MFRYSLNTFMSNRHSGSFVWDAKDIRLSVFHSFSDAPPESAPVCCLDVLWHELHLITVTGYQPPYYYHRHQVYVTSVAFVTSGVNDNEIAQQTCYWVSCMIANTHLPYHLSEWQQRCSHWGTCRRWACQGRSVPAGWQTGVPQPYRLWR